MDILLVVLTVTILVYEGELKESVFAIWYLTNGSETMEQEGI